jgi:hypothetical protein
MIDSNSFWLYNYASKNKLFYVIQIAEVSPAALQSTSNT